MSGYIDIPKEVAICPYCDSELIAMPSAWTEYDGEMLVTEIELDCRNMPDIPDREYIASHAVMPYVYWLPVYEKALQWIKSNQPTAGAT